MTLFQIITLVLAILATLYQIIKILQVAAYMRRYVYVNIKWTFYAGMLTAVFFQVLCIWAFFGAK